jgi:hypothetical protein
MRGPGDREMRRQEASAERDASLLERAARVAGLSVADLSKPSRGRRMQRREVPPRGRLAQRRQVWVNLTAPDLPMARRRRDVVRRGCQADRIILVQGVAP